MLKTIDDAVFLRKRMKERSARNQTLTVNENEKPALLSKAITLRKATKLYLLKGKVIYQDLTACSKFLPNNFIDLLIADPLII